MKTLPKILFVFILLQSCTGTDSGEIRMNKFISNYKDSFVNSDLTLFSYNPRCKFENFTDSTAYRIFIREDGKLLISTWNDKQTFDSASKIERLIIDYLNILKEKKSELTEIGIENPKWIEKDADGSYLISGDSVIYRFPKNTFEFDPIQYFENLDSLIDKFGIIEIKNHRDYIQLVFDSDKSLIYYLAEIKPKDTIDKNLKRIDKNWFISREKLNLDYY